MLSATQQRNKLRDEISAMLSTRAPIGGRSKHLEHLAKRVIDMDGDIAQEREEQRGIAFRRWQRGGKENLDVNLQQVLGDLTVEARDLAGGGGISFSTNSYLVPMDYHRQIVSSMRFVGPMVDENLVSWMTTSNGRLLAFPSDTDATQTGMIVTEAQQVPMQDVNGLVMTTLGSAKFSSGIIKVSSELLQDQEVDLPSYLEQRFATRLGRIMNTKFTVGSGSGEPTGFITAAASAGVCTGSSDSDGSGAGNTIGLNDCTVLLRSVDPEYRMSPSAAFQAHPNVIESMRQVKTKDGAPAFLGLHNSPDGIDRVLNHRILANPAMDTLQANPLSPAITKKVLAFGAWDRYQVRAVRMWLTRLNERFSDTGQVAFIAWIRADGNIVDQGQPIKFLETIF